MKTQLKTSKKLAKHIGANAVEYGLVMAVIVALMIAGGQMMEGDVQGLFTDAAKKMRNLVNL